MSDHYLAHIAMHRRARHTAPASRLARHRYHVRKLQDLHVREAYSAHIASQLPMFTGKMQQLSTTENLRPAELTQAAVSLFEDTLVCSARELLGLKRCVQVKRHTWWTPELRLLIDQRRAIYVDCPAQSRYIDIAESIVGTSCAEAEHPGFWEDAPR